MEKKNEFPLFNVKSFGRRNIILAISDEKVILYTINKGTNNNETFFCFMKNLVDNIGEDKISEYLIIMDNCTIHLHQKLKDFYKEKRMKILTIVPYASQLNAVELVFGFINPLASPSAGAPKLKYGDVNTVTPSPGKVKGLNNKYIGKNFLH